MTPFEQMAMDMIAAAYERGRFVAKQRAISRARLGLPIERGVEPAGGDVNDYHDTETRTPGWFIRLDRG